MSPPLCTATTLAGYDLDLTLEGVMYFFFFEIQPIIQNVSILFSHFSTLAFWLPLTVRIFKDSIFSLFRDYII